MAVLLSTLYKNFFKKLNLSKSSFGLLTFTVNFLSPPAKDILGSVLLLCFGCKLILITGCGAEIVWCIIIIFSKCSLVRSY